MATITAVNTRAAAALGLGVAEYFRHDLSIGMATEDGSIAIRSIGENYMPALTTDGIDCLREPIAFSLRPIWSSDPA